MKKVKGPMSEVFDTIILAGSLSHSLLRKQMGRPVSALPVSREHSVLSAWHQKVIAADPGGSQMLLISSENENPMNTMLVPLDGVDVLVDRRKHRGVAGVIRDAILEQRQSADSNPILVVEATANPSASIERLLEAHRANRSDITFGMDEHQHYAGCLVMRRQVLELVPDLGYFDLKEQLAQAVRSDGGRLSSAKVVRRAVRIHSLQAWRIAVDEWASDANAMEESTNDRALRSIVDPRVRAIDGRVIDSIIMEHATISEGSIIARSAVGPNAFVPPGIRVIDSVYL